MGTCMGVPVSHYNDLEYSDRITGLASALLREAHGIGSEKDTS